MEKSIDSDSTPAMLASKAFHDILSKIQSSNLNFQLRISPFSAQISLKKTIVKDKTGAPLLLSTNPNTSECITDLVAKNHQLEKDNFDLSKKYEEVVTDNEKLRNTINVRNSQLESAKNESYLLQSKLELNEKEMYEYFIETKEKDTKHLNETCALKARIKEDSETLTQQKRAAMEASKTRKSLEKNVYNLEKKVENLNDKIESLKASKNDLKAERDTLIRENKNLQRHSHQIQGTKFAWTQTNPEQNNNLPSKPTDISTCSTSVQTSEGHESIPIPDVKLDTFVCFVCNEDFYEAKNLKEHAKNEHKIELQLATLLDFKEDDPFVRFVKSIDMGREYVSKRINLYPQHWDQIEERISIRMMAKKKLEICSKHIEKNMKENDVRSIIHHRKCHDSAEI